MEKKIAHYLLADVKALVVVDQFVLTNAANIGADALGLDVQGVKNAILQLEISNFYKTMTTHADHRIWQDVYHLHLEGVGAIYLKLTVVDLVLVVSFKEL